MDGANERAEPMRRMLPGHTARALRAPVLPAGLSRCERKAAREERSERTTGA